MDPTPPTPKPNLEDVPSWTTQYKREPPDSKIHRDMPSLFEDPTYQLQDTSGGAINLSLSKPNQPESLSNVSSGPSNYHLQMTRAYNIPYNEISTLFTSTNNDLGTYSQKTTTGIEVNEPNEWSRPRVATTNSFVPTDSKSLHMPVFNTLSLSNTQTQADKNLPNIHGCIYPPKAQYPYPTNAAISIPKHGCNSLATPSQNEMIGPVIRQTARRVNSLNAPTRQGIMPSSTLITNETSSLSVPVQSAVESVRSMYTQTTPITVPEPKRKVTSRGVPHLQNECKRTRVTAIQGPPQNIIKLPIVHHLIHAAANPKNICDRAYKLLFIVLKWTKEISTFEKFSLLDRISLLHDAWGELFIFGAAQILSPMDLTRLLIVNPDAKPEDFDRFREVVKEVAQMNFNSNEVSCLKAVILFRTYVSDKTSQNHLQQGEVTSGTSKKNTLTVTHKHARLLLREYVYDQGGAQMLRMFDIMKLLGVIQKVPTKLIEDLFFKHLIGNTKMKDILTNIYINYIDRLNIESD